MLSRSLPTAHTSSVYRAEHLLRRAYPIDGAVELVSPARAAGNYFVRRRMLAHSVLAAHTSSVCRAQHLLRRAYRTRMTERQKLSVPHAPLEIVLSWGAYSHISCQPPAALHPIDEAVESVSPARDAGNYFAREYMLSRSLPAAHTSSVCRAQHLLRRAYHTRMMRRWNLSARHAPLEIVLSWGACSHISCQPPAALHPIDEAVELAGPARDAGNYFVRECVLLHHVPAELD